MHCENCGKSGERRDCARNERAKSATFQFSLHLFSPPYSPNKFNSALGLSKTFFFCTFSRLGIARTSSTLLSAYRKRSFFCTFSRLGIARASPIALGLMKWFVFVQQSCARRPQFSSCIWFLVLFASKKGLSYEQSDPESRAVKSAPRIGGCLLSRKRVAVPSAVHPCVSLNRAATCGEKHL